MALPDKQPGLPDITESDIRALLADFAEVDDDVKDPDPYVRWETMRHKYPVLCKEIDNQARTEVLLSSMDVENSEQLTLRLNRFATHILQLLEIAIGRIERERAEEIRRTTTLHFSDGDDGVGLPL